MKNRMRCALIGLILGFSACSVSSTAEPEASEPIPTTEVGTASALTDPAAPDAASNASCDGAGCVEEFDPDIQAFEDQFTAVSNGIYRFENLGTEFTIRIIEPTWVQPNEPSRIVLTAPSSTGPGDQDLIMLRPTHLANPSDLGNGEANPFDPDDLDAWLDGVQPGLEITDRREVEVGGTPGVRFDLELNPAYECGPEACAFFAFSQTAAVWFDPGRFYRIWHFGQGDEAPVVFVAGTRATDDDWLRQADEMLSSLAFGPIEPHPIPTDVILWEAGFSADVPAGVVTLPIAGGITFELNEDRFINQQEGKAQILLPDQPGENDLLIARSTQAGPIGSLSSAVERLQEHPSVEVIESEEVTVGGGRYEAVKVIITGRSAPVLSTEDPFDEGSVWLPPINGTLWFIDIGESSPLLVSSETFGSADLLEITDATAELLLATLEIG